MNANVHGSCSPIPDVAYKCHGPVPCAGTSLSAELARWKLGVRAGTGDGLVNRRERHVESAVEETLRLQARVGGWIGFKS
jgi:hypothetical protein